MIRTGIDGKRSRHRSGRDGLAGDGWSTEIAGRRVAVDGSNVTRAVERLTGETERSQWGAARPPLPNRLRSTAGRPRTSAARGGEKRWIRPDDEEPWGVAAARHRRPQTRSPLPVPRRAKDARGHRTPPTPARHHHEKDPAHVSVDRVVIIRWAILGSNQ